MSALPRDPTDSANAEGHAAVLPARFDVEQFVNEFRAASVVLSVSAPPPEELSRLCRQVAALTAELFPGEPRIRVKNDPEIPDDLYFLFSVDATGSADEIARR